MKRLHVGVVGVGSFGHNHVRHLSVHPLVERVTVADASAAKAASVAAKYGAIPARHLNDAAIDAAVVVVPTEHHCAVAAPLLERGIGVFIEKPIAANPRDAESLLALASNHGALVQVGHVERFSPAVRSISDSARAVSYVRARRHNPPRSIAPTADVVLDLMIHDIDLALSLARTPVSRVTALVPDGIGQEAAVARLEFVDGMVADLSASRLSPVVERTLTVHDAAGVFQADLAAKRLDRTAGGIVSPVSLAQSDNLASEIDDFLAAVSGRKSPLVDGESGLAALKVAHEIRGAIASHYRLSA
ncbi:MAG: Gfo/Idh/MocA family oxidoreductase [Pseudomonadota bacterium]